MHRRRPARRDVRGAEDRPCSGGAGKGRHGGLERGVVGGGDRGGAVEGVEAGAGGAEGGEGGEGVGGGDGRVPGGGVRCGYYLGGGEGGSLVVHGGFVGGLGGWLESFVLLGLWLRWVECWDGEKRLL